MIVTWEEALAEREARGRAKGQAEARAEDMARVKQDDLLLVARYYLASVPAGFEEKVRAISDLDCLNDLLVRLLKTNDVGGLE